MRSELSSTPINNISMSPSSSCVTQGHKFLEEVENFANDLAEALDALLVSLKVEKDNYESILDFDIEAIRCVCRGT